MKEPKIATTVNGYTLSFEDALSVKVARVNVHSSDGRVTGELQISNSSIDNPVLLLPATQFNFSSDPTRAKFAKQLKEKYPDSKTNWTELFDYLAYKIQELARAGEPIEEVWPTDDVPELEYFVNPVIIKNQSNIIYGGKGMNKSTLAYTLGTILSLRWDDNPLDFAPYRVPVKSLILDWETDRETFNYYLRRPVHVPRLRTVYKQCLWNGKNISPVTP